MYNYMSNDGGYGDGSVGVNIDQFGVIAYNILDSFYYGIYSRGAYNLKIYNNLIKGSVRAIDNYTNATYVIYVRNNVFWNISQYYIYSHTTNNPSMDYNIYDATSTGADWILDGYTFINFSTFQAAGYEAHGYDGTPEMGSDYRPTNEGNLMDVGQDVSITKDYIGSPVPDGVAPDLGIYEYQHTITPPAVEVEGQQKRRIVFITL